MFQVGDRVKLTDVGLTGKSEGTLATVTETHPGKDVSVQFDGDSGVFRMDGRLGLPGHRFSARRFELFTGSDELAEFKAKVWAVARTAKNKHGWCDEIDEMLEELGVTDPNPKPKVVGDPYPMGGFVTLAVPDKGFIYFRGRDGAWDFVSSARDKERLGTYDAVLKHLKGLNPYKTEVLVRLR